ncbi:glucose-1-phosphate cytidylyltransferase [Azospirillum sp. TSH64]|uniref:glucose-1-phosphate cytidylyltransferase n=1 Tax=Azospirillum sp. TSH64 TaxID=652740 RepID=UPI000D604380|nr:glucose-1-phosphate cytidylyltransferase [Azospirillum sp. TSH64]PWC73983.1 glucose-1-phosphate cytidylyltransferase [Azospirillum sp. TSH64]PWC81153.1 glucose-1-phosphate cytidylyltransferase [Azospirillum sp. TSH64]
MKAVILAGGLGTRLSEETDLRPKPMVEIGGKPILWHIMKIYSSHGINDFVICLGYKGYAIKEYFSSYSLHNSDVTIDLRTNTIEVHRRLAEPWRITLVETGESTLTGGRIKRVLPYLEGEEAFCLTYGDGVGNVDISAAITFHKAHGRAATMTVVHPPGRYGLVELEGDRISAFQEKLPGDGARINGGFFVLSPTVGRYIDGDDTMWEQEPLRRLVEDGQLHAWKHDGFWQCMDTIRDKRLLEDLWIAGNPPWKSW